MERGNFKDILVVNYTSPEMDYLASAISKLGRLMKYLRPYAGFDGPLTARIAGIPGLSRLYKNTFGRRTMPAGLKPEDVHCISVGRDLCIGLCRNYFGHHGERLSRNIHWRIQNEIESAAARYASASSVIFSRYFISRAPLLKSRGLKILNYPSVHHKYLQEVVHEEKELQPAFGDMLPDWNQMPAWVDKQLDDECDLADIILVGSSFAMKSFITQGVPKEKIRIVPYGTDVALFKKVSRNSSPSDPLRVVFVGRIGQLKGISYLLEAARRLPGKQFSFTLVGGIQGDKKALLPYENYFTYTPHQPRAMLPQVYRNQDVFVFPTLLEGMGLVVLEAMASGLPVITTANGPGDIVRDGIDGFIVPVRNYDAICDCLEILRARPELREEMSRNARQRALEYSWDAYMERIAGLVSDLDIRAGEH